ncbi:MAG: hypothetical protein IID45_05955, partial [Planctomycetes bacterium]|nr:hypothetical protein [Planctomycetota bacterium]
MSFAVWFAADRLHRIRKNRIRKNRIRKKSGTAKRVVVAAEETQLGSGIRDEFRDRRAAAVVRDRQNFPGAFADFFGFDFVLNPHQTFQQGFRT